MCAGGLKLFEIFKKYHDSLYIFDALKSTHRKTIIHPIVISFQNQLWKVIWSHFELSGAGRNRLESSGVISSRAESSGVLQNQSFGVLVVRGRPELGEEGRWPGIWSPTPAGSGRTKPLFLERKVCLRSARVKRNRKKNTTKWNACRLQPTSFPDKSFFRRLRLTPDDSGRLQTTPTPDDYGRLRATLTLDE